MNRRPLLVSGFVLGVGLGGLLDGIILHQILQWHHLVSSVYPTDTLQGLELNTLWDGLFHIVMYVITAVGLFLLWRAVTRRGAVHSPRTVIGALLLGVGSFHVLDSVLNHWVLGIHHICYEPNAAACDAGFFALGIVFLIAGGALVRGNDRRARIEIED
ncbi:MAG: DUF2243 domain-containing protein [Chloroflexi bacterium]|nr:DUF2243 domain-containing protein [Chloroflexota bacterium]